MFPRMPPTNSRKRPAPGASPSVPAQMQQPFGTPAQMSTDQFLRWSQNGEAIPYTDASGYNMNTYGGSGSATNQQFPQSMPQSSNQLARRPVNRQLVSTAPRNAFDNLGDPWGSFGDDGLTDPQIGMLEENDNIELLEERAVIAKRDAQSKRKQIPPFVQKLSSFLDESKNTDLIRWSDRGDSFVVLDEDEFAKTLIPELFKHNNYASFVRQLNMYGFHKRVGLSDNSMKASERKNKSPSEYYNPYFKRGHPNLLWLINKPKGGNAQKKAKGTRIKSEENGEADSDEDARDGVEETVTGNYGQNQGTRAISAAPESGPLQRREMVQVQTQLQEIQKQQGAISSAISRLRKDHNQLYQQAMAFQTLHDRHESSINAILTFLATVYNRSLDGQGGGNIAQMFANAIPQDSQQNQGNVVDIVDVGSQGQSNAGGVSPIRRQQRLLMAPPSSGQQSAGASPSTSSRGLPTPNYQSMNQQAGHGSIEELFENSPSDSPQIKSEQDSLPQQDMMNIINNTNAQGGRLGSKSLNFPDVLSHYENSNGNSPLTSEQRNNMLNLIANSSTAAGSTNNALVSPIPPPQHTLESLGYTQAEIDELVRMQQEQEAKLHEVSSLIQPLSPSGSIPGLNDNQYFNTEGTDLSQSGSNLDLDQFLDPGAYYANGEGGDYDYNSFGIGNGMGDASNFDFSLDGAASNDRLPGDGNTNADAARIVEAADSTPATPDEINPPADKDTPQRSPSKKRRKG